MRNLIILDISRLSLMKINGLSFVVISILLIGFLEVKELLFTFKLAAPANISLQMAIYSAQLYFVALIKISLFSVLGGVLGALAGLIFHWPINKALNLLGGIWITVVSPRDYAMIEGRQE